MISIVTPAKKAGHHIHRNLRMMEMQSGDFEHIVQESGSDDDTLNQIQKYQDRYPLVLFSEADNGMYDAIGRGFARARGDVFGWLGADDYYLPWTLSTVERIFSEHEDLEWIIGMPALAYDNDRIVKVNPLAPVYIRSFIRSGLYRPGCLGFLQQEAMFWRRRLWERVDGAQVVRKFLYAGDYHLWRAFATETNLVTVASVLGVFVSSPEQLSRSHWEKYQAEAGFTCKSDHASALGKLLNRCIAICLSHKVIRPELGIQ